jgi:hypothetical protein
VRFKAFGDLPADGHYRVERGHRLLKDHRDFSTAKCAHDLGGLLQKVDDSFVGPVLGLGGTPKHLAGDSSCRAEQAQNRQRCCALA